MDSPKAVLLIGTPFYEGKVSAAYARSVLGFQDACSGRRDVEFTGLAQWGDSLLTRAKQGILTQLLVHPTATHLLFVDGDVSFEPGQVFRLLSMDVEVAAGVLEGRESWPPEVPRPEGKKGFAKVPFAGTAFMLLKKSAVLRMNRRYPELRYRNEFPQPGAGPTSLWNYALFNCLIDPKTGAFLDGDQSFCLRWTDMEGEIWMDLGNQPSF